MMNHISLMLAALLLVFAVLGCNHASGGNPWMDCNGSHGAALSCKTFGARVVSASRYDSNRRCFMPRARIDDLCGIPTYCPGGGGELACFVHSGEAYAVYVLYGEEVSNSTWHHDANAALDSTLTKTEQTLCDELWQAQKDASYAGDAGSVLVDTVSGAMAEVSPDCAG